VLLEARSRGIDALPSLLFLVGSWEKITLARSHVCTRARGRVGARALAMDTEDAILRWLAPDETGA
jgi:hypothetical protein